MKKIKTGNIDKLIKDIDSLQGEDRYEFFEKFFSKEAGVKEPIIKLCPYCSTRLWMSIERQNKCCWDCHYEGKDQMMPNDRDVQECDARDDAMKNKCWVNKKNNE